MREKEQTAAGEDSDLVLLCKKGSLDAFEELVKRHQKRMLNIAFRMVGNYEDACEVVQDAFVSAYRGIREFKGKAMFSTWLYTIVINLSRNRIKQIKTRSIYEQYSINDPLPSDDSRINAEPESSEPSILERLERQDVQQKVQECINSMENGFREVIILRDIQGFSYDEIGDILKIPDGTVKSRVFRARESLKGCLKKALGEL